MKIRIILRALACCIIVLVVLEVCARVDDYLSFGAPLWASYNSEALYQVDGIGKHGKPLARYKKWQLNSLGFRGPEPQSGMETIICLGSSETFGLYESPGAEYPRQLEREIRNKTGKDNFQVVNVAYPGETIPTATRRIPEIINALNPTYAFVYPSPANYIWLPSVRPSRETKPKPVANPRFEWRIAENFRVILKQLIPSGVQTRLRQYEIERAAQEFDVFDQVADRNIETLKQDLLNLVDELRTRGVEPILVTHATYFGNSAKEGDRQMLVAWRKFYPMLKEEGFADMEARANEAIRKSAAENNITLVDAASKIPPGGKYFADFVHFTDEGAHQIAVRMADGLQQALTKRSYRATVAPQSAVGAIAEPK